MKKYIVGFALLFVMIQFSYGQTASLKNKMKDLIEDNFVFAAKQYQYLKVGQSVTFTGDLATNIIKDKEVIRNIIIK